MDLDIQKCLQNININFDLSKTYINDLFLLIKNILKPFHKKYSLKKRYIVKEIYYYFTNILNIHKDVIRISKLRQPIQRSQEWYDARYNKITASEIASVIGTDMSNICESETKKIYKKAAFKNSYDLMKTKIFKNDEFKGNIYTDWGILFEPVATLIYEHRNQNRIIEFGLIEHPTNALLAASPDGITQYNATMIEIKAPYKRVLSGLVPLNYWMQMQLQMETCNLDVCHFVEVKTHIYSKEEYDDDNCNDSNNNMLYTNNKMEKGIIIKCLDKDNKITYFYPPFEAFRNSIKLDKWIEEQTKYYENLFETVELVYWKLLEYSCIEINRDKNWFNSILPKCEEFWKKVLYYKTNINEFIELDNKKEAEKQKRRNKQTKVEFEKLNVLTMLDSDSDNELDEIKKNIVNNDLLNNESLNYETLNYETLNNETNNDMIIDISENCKNLQENTIISNSNYDSSSDTDMNASMKNRSLMDSIEDDLELFTQK